MYAAASKPTGQARIRIIFIGLRVIYSIFAGRLPESSPQAAQLYRSAGVSRVDASVGQLARWT
jgi:hypothetical protein